VHLATIAQCIVVALWFDMPRPYLASRHLFGEAAITDRACLPVKVHSLTGCISLHKCFLLHLGSKPRWCADRRQENLPPASKGRLVVLTKPEVLGAIHPVT
jgi:hypothetical protein